MKAQAESRQTLVLGVYARDKHDIIDYRDVIILVMQGLYLVYLVSSQGHFQRRQWHPTPLLLPEKSHGWRSLVGCIQWGR